MRHILEGISQGKLYIVEMEFRKLICKILGFIGIVDDNKNKYTFYTIKKILHEKYYELYSDEILNLSLISYNMENTDIKIREIINKICCYWYEKGNIFEELPNFFMDESVSNHKKITENFFIEHKYGRKIIFDTVHGVKGETHDATLYLETEKGRSSDIKRVLPYFGIGKFGSKKEAEQNRKCVYVGMSRSRKLLCLAIQDSTYEKLGKVFENWKLIDCRIEKHI